MTLRLLGGGALTNEQRAKRAGLNKVGVSAVGLSRGSGGNVMRKRWFCSHDGPCNGRPVNHTGSRGNLLKASAAYCDSDILIWVFYPTSSHWAKYNKHQQISFNDLSVVVFSYFCVTGWSYFACI